MVYGLPGAFIVRQRVRYRLFFRLSFTILMANMMAEQIVVMTFVMTSGQFSSMMPWITKRIDPRPSMQNVGMAMPSVLRVRIVAIA